MSTNLSKGSVAVIGGEGKMPFLVLEGLRKAARPSFLLSIRDMSSPELSAHADESISLYLTQIGKAIAACEKRGIKELVFAGRVQHKSIYSLSPLRMDFTTIKLWWKMKDRRTDALIGQVAAAFEAKGIQIVTALDYLQDYLAKEGVLTSRQPPQRIMEDIRFGTAFAKELGRMDIGQTVVVKDRAVVAVEAMEGTNDCLERAKKIAGSGAVVVKLAKPKQDLRWDLPTIGMTTIEKLKAMNASALAIEAHKTLIIDEKLVEAADRLGIPIVSLTEAQIEASPSLFCASPA